MARYFKEQDIDEFRECFYLHARSGHIKSVDELTTVMRSLGTSPTIAELRDYMKQKGGQLSFADFLDILHTHRDKEDVPKELLAAFRCMDVNKTGMIPARDLQHILGRWGERLSPREIDQLFREARIQPNGSVRYEEFVKILCSPAPDYF